MKTPILPRDRRAFSLVELLVVLALLGLLTSLAIPAFQSARSASSLSSAGQMVVAELNFARQTALSRGFAVQVRFYQLPGYGEDRMAPPSAYRAIQSFSIDGAVTNALDKATFFPPPARASVDPAASPLLQTAETGSYRLPEVGINYRYAPLLFNPDGSLDSAVSTNAFLTLVLDRAPIRAGNLPANFVKQ